MAIVFQTVNVSVGLTVTNGDEMLVFEGVRIGNTSGAAVQLAAGTLETAIHNKGIVAGGTGVRIESRYATIVNNADIIGLTSEAIDMSYNGSDTAFFEIINTGYLYGKSEIIDYSGGGPVRLNLFNSGEMIAEDSSAEIIYPIDPVDLASISIVNSGLIRGGDLYMTSSGVGRLQNTGSILASTIEADGTGVMVITNHGFIGAYLRTGSNADRVVTTGTISGNISLNENADRYDAFGAGVTTGYVWGGTGNDTLTGGEDADRLLGQADDDLVVGRGGDDFLNGGSGLDTILGGAGNDSIEGDSDNDVLSGNAGDDTILGEDGNDVLVGQDGSDSLDGGGNDDILDGGPGSDILEGGTGNDILRGRAGEDELAGGLGMDLLTGGQGADSFVFRSTADAGIGAARDQILDFEQGLDLIIVAGLSPGVFEFRGTAAFAPSGNPELRLFETPTGSTIVQLDANGDGVTDAEIRVANVTGLTAEDFTL